MSKMSTVGVNGLATIDISWRCLRGTWSDIVSFATTVFTDVLFLGVFQDENPIYKQATSTYKNPTYTKKS